MQLMLDIGQNIISNSLLMLVAKMLLISIQHIIIAII